MSDSATPWTAAYQAPPPMGFSRQEYFSVSSTEVTSNGQCSLWISLTCDEKFNSQRVRDAVIVLVSSRATVFLLLLNEWAQT